MERLSTRDCALKSKITELLVAKSVIVAFRENRSLMANRLLPAYGPHLGEKGTRMMCS